MTAERFDSIEARTRRVENAVIKFEYIADVILVKLDERIGKLETHDEELSRAIHKSCDDKTGEIDDKISASMGEVKAILDKSFNRAISMTAGLFFLFVSGLAYTQSEVSAVEKQSTENTTNITNIHKALDKIDSKLDKIISR